MIQLQEFQRLDLQIGQVTSVEAIPNARRLLKLEVDLGRERRTLVAGLAGAGCSSGEVALLTVDRAVANGTPVA